MQLLTHRQSIVPVWTPDRVGGNTGARTCDPRVGRQGIYCCPYSLWCHFYSPVQSGVCTCGVVTRMAPSTPLCFFKFSSTARCSSDVPGGVSTSSTSSSPHATSDTNWPIKAKEGGDAGTEKKTSKCHHSSKAGGQDAAGVCVVTKLLVQDVLQLKWILSLWWWICSWAAESRGLM